MLVIEWRAGMENKGFKKRAAEANYEMLIQAPAAGLDSWATLSGEGPEEPLFPDLFSGEPRQWK